MIQPNIEAPKTPVPSALMSDEDIVTHFDASWVQMQDLADISGRSVPYLKKLLLGS